VKRPVPMDAIYISFHSSGKSEVDFPVWDLMSDMLAKGNSSRLYQRLVKERGIFNSLGAFVTGEKDPGLFSVAGYISQGVAVEVAEQALWDELELLRTAPVAEAELKKAVHQVEAHIEFSQMNILNRAIQLAYYELLGDAELANAEIETYRKVTAADVQRMAKEHLLRERSSTLVYRAVK